MRLFWLRLYGGWSAERASLTLLEGKQPIALQCLPLVRSAATPAGGIEAEVVCVGRGKPDVFAAAGDRLRGRMALVRHEYMFAAGHIHRVYLAAMDQAARTISTSSAAVPSGAIHGSSQAMLGWSILSRSRVT